MQRHIVNLFLLALLFLLNDCRKGGDDQPSQFVVTGIHDVTIDSSNSHVLNIMVKQTSGDRQPVAIEVFGLPPIVFVPHYGTVVEPVAVYPTIGLPDFSCELNFSQYIPKGIYHVRVVATSAFYRTEDSMLVFASGNEFTINGAHDIVLSSPSDYDTLPITVTHVSGIRAQVSLNATNIDDPADVHTHVFAELYPDVGYPDFTSNVVFKRVSASKAGTYRFVISGSNMSFSKLDTINVTVP